MLAAPGLGGETLWDAFCNISHSPALRSKVKCCGISLYTMGRCVNYDWFNTELNGHQLDRKRLSGPYGDRELWEEEGGVPSQR